MNQSFFKTIVLQTIESNKNSRTGSAILKMKGRDNPNFSISTFGLESKDYVLGVAYFNGQFEFFNFFENGKFSFSSSLNFSTFQEICAVIFLKEGLVPICYGEGNNFKVKIKEFQTRYYAQNNQKSEKENSQENDEKNSAEKTNPTAQELSRQLKGQTSTKIVDNQTEYDDFLIADYNYFENIPNQKKDDSYDEPVYNEINPSFAFIQEEREQEKTCNAPPRSQTETGTDKEQKQPQYYALIKDKIEELFEKYPPISALSKVIPQSKWIKVEQNENDFYVIGRLYLNNEITHVAYGVFGSFGALPKGFDEQTSFFIPESLFSLCQNGYWCIFQCAKTGETIVKAK